MGKVTTDLPEGLERDIAGIAAAEGCTVEEFLGRAAAEKMAALKQVAKLRAEASKGDRGAFERFLAAAGDEEPGENDRL
jgi:hypothetical protein